MQILIRSRTGELVEEKDISAFKDFLFYFAKVEGVPREKLERAWKQTIDIFKRRMLKK